MSQSAIRQSDLVLTVVGGVRHGKTLSISTSKCVLAFDYAGSDHQETPQPVRCAILRGKAGVTIRNLDKLVSINGHFTPTHWLKEGDLIQYPNSVALRVTQLGSLDLESEFATASEFTKNEFQSSSHEELFQSDSADSEITEIESLVHSFESQNQLMEPVDSDSVCPGNVQSQFAGSLGDDLAEINNVTEMVDSRFVEIEKRIDRLTEQISSLVTMAASGHFLSADLRESEWKAHVNSPGENQNSGIQEWTSESHPDRIENVQQIPNSLNEIFDKPALESTSTSLGNTTPDASETSQDSEPSVNYDHLAGRFCQTSIAESSTANYLVPVRREEDSQQAAAFWQQPLNESEKEPESVINQSAPDSLVAESVVGGTAPTSTAGENTPNDARNSVLQSMPGFFGSFRAATNALDHLNRTVDSSLESKSNSSGVDEKLSASFQPRTEAAATTIAPTALEAASAATGKDETLDALLKRLYQSTGSQNADSSASVKDSFPGNAEVQSTNSNYGYSLPENEASVSDSLVTNTDPIHYGNAQYGYDADSSSAESRSYDNLQSEVGVNHESDVQYLSDTNPVTADESSRIAIESEVGKSVGLPEPKSSSGNSEIMELLAKLKAEGAWDDDESVQDVKEASHHSQDTAAQMETSQFISDAAFETEAAEVHSLLEHPGDPMPEEPAAEEEESVSADSVDDYMSQLLARMQKKRGDSAPISKKQSDKVIREAEAKLALDQRNAGQELMTAEEYVPKQKAQKFQSFDTMREIANATARTNVAFSDLDRRRTKGYMQIIISMGALIMAVYGFVFLSKEAMDTPFLMGCVCIAIALGAGYLGFVSLIGLKNHNKNSADQD